MTALPLGGPPQLVRRIGKRWLIDTQRREAPQ